MSTARVILSIPSLLPRRDGPQNAAPKDWSNTAPRHAAVIPQEIKPGVALTQVHTSLRQNSHITQLIHVIRKHVIRRLWHAQSCASITTSLQAIFISPKRNPVPTSSRLLSKPSASLTDLPLRTSLSSRIFAWSWSFRIGFSLRPLRCSMNQSCVVFTAEEHYCIMATSRSVT